MRALLSPLTSTFLGAGGVSIGGAKQEESVERVVRVNKDHSLWNPEAGHEGDKVVLRETASRQTEKRREVNEVEN